VNQGFSRALDAIDGIDGWLSDDQAKVLFDRAAAVPAGGTIVEIGSFRGRSTIVLALGAGADVSVVAIDPHTGDDRGPREWQTSGEQGRADRLAFQLNLKRAGVAGLVRHLPRRSLDALRDVEGEVELVYVDGAHGYRPAREDVVRWGAKLAPEGALLIHDAFSAVGVTLAILRELAIGQEFRYRGRWRSLAEYRRVDPGLAVPQRLLNCARQMAQLPWFARNLAIKLALVIGLRRVAIALGLRREDRWPY
jgi:predicted O-methyltransferase YrrM